MSLKFYAAPQYAVSTCRLRRLAACIAFICLWMASAGVLHHTDDLQMGSSSSSHASIARPTPAPPADQCAACESLQGVLSGSPAVAPVMVPALVLRTFAAQAVVALVSQIPERPSARAPPMCF